MSAARHPRPATTHSARGQVAVGPSADKILSGACCPGAGGGGHPMSAALYQQTKTWLLVHDSDAPRILDWAQRDLGPPACPERLAFEVIWVILCAGRSAQAARTIEGKVHAAIAAGTPVVEAFGYRAKAVAIERAWRERETDFAQLQDVLSRGDVSAIVDWCAAIPFIGDDTKYQLAKAFGVQFVKPVMTRRFSYC